MLGPLILAGFGLGMVIAPAINTGTFGVGAVVGGVLLRRGPLGQKRTPSPAPGGATTAPAEADRERAR